MKNLQWRIILIVFLCLIFGAACDYSAYNISLESKIIRTFDQNGTENKLAIIDYPIKKKILNSTSVLLYSLGFSIFITCFISGRLNKMQMKQKEKELEQLQNAINVNVFDSLFKTLMPEEIYSIIKSQIIENKVIRKDVKWFYDFNVNDNGEILLKQTTNCKLVNISKINVQSPIQVIIRNADENNNSILNSAICTYKGNKIMNYEQNNPEKCIGITSDKSNLNEVIHNINIEIPPEESVELTMVFTNYYKDSVHDEHFTSRPLVDLELIVTFPINYEFSFFQNMSTKLVCTLKDENRHMYKAEGGLLPNQGIVYFLKKKKIES